MRKNVFELNWFDLLTLNPKQVNALDIEHIRKILYTCSNSWYNKLAKLSLSFSIYIEVFCYRVKRVSI